MTATDPTMVELALTRWVETGDATGLGAAADWLDERGERGELAATLRLVMESTMDVRFFYANARFDGDENARLLNACKLAFGEAWMTDNPRYDVRWDLDPEAWEYDGHSEDDGDEPIAGWVCHVQEWDPATGARRGCVASRDGVYFASGDPKGEPLARVVAAELAVEVVSEPATSV